MNHQPATPLPWSATDDGYVVASGDMTVADADENTSYIAHAANAYPKLVEALAQSVAYMIANPATSLHETQRIALLTAFGDLQRELGEAQ